MHLQLLQRPEPVPPRQSLFLEDGLVEVLPGTLVFHQSNGPIVLYLDEFTLSNLKEALKSAEADDLEET